MPPTLVGDPQDMHLRCVIVDDSQSLLAAARVLLEREGIAVVGVASTSAEAVQLVDELQPDVALIDIDLGESSGFDLVRQLEDGAVKRPPTSILISADAAEDFADLIDASPAVGFMSKSDLCAKAIRATLKGPRER